MSSVAQFNQHSWTRQSLGNFVRQATVAELQRILRTDETALKVFDGDRDGFLKLLMNDFVSENLQKQPEKDRINDKKICVLIGYDAKVLAKDMKYMINVNKGELLEYLYCQGYRLSDEECDLFLNRDETQNIRKADDDYNIDGLFSTWETTQELMDSDYQLHDDIWQGIRTTADLENHSAPAKKDTRFQTEENLYWQAARAHRFERILDMYIAEEKPLPLKTFLAPRKQFLDDTCLLNLLAFSREPNIWRKIYHPVLWRRQLDKFPNFYRKLPDVAKIDGSYQCVMNNVRGHILKRAAAKSPLAQKWRAKRKKRAQFC